MKIIKWNRVISGTVAAAMLATLVAVQAAPVSAAATIRVTVDEKAVNFPDQKPIMDNDRVLIPTRFVAQQLGGKVEYKKSSKTVTIQQGNKTIKLMINSAKVTAGGKTVMLDVPAKIVRGRTMVPLRFVSEAMGASVDWNQARSLVSITTGNAVPTPTAPAPSNGNFKFDMNYTTLAKQLFVNNLKEENGKVSFALPSGATATYYTNKGTGTKLTPGQDYSYPVGPAAGYISFTYVDPAKVVPGSQKQAEYYTIALDPTLEGRSSSSSAVVTVEDSKLKSYKGTISEVIELAKRL